jgi:hypothetical protein
MNNKARKSWFLALVIFLMMATLHYGSSHHRRDANQVLRVLFIGNSFTYSNDLPSIVEALAETAGRKRPAFKAVVFGGYSLEDHWAHGEARREISRAKWDVVVLQQGPSASTEGRLSLLEYTRRFSEEIRRARARPALYMVWPSVERAKDFDRVSESYQMAAKEVEGLLLPAGEAWRMAWRRDPNLKLYSMDGLHPTLMGSYLAALVMYEQLYGQAFEGTPHRLKLRSGTELEIPREQARLLEEAAAEANQKFGRR